MIDRTAIINSKAKLNKNVQVGPYCVIGPNVEIGENTIIQSHVNISGNVKIGRGNKIYPFVSINDPQDLKYNGEPTNLIIGDNKITPMIFGTTIAKIMASEKLITAPRLIEAPTTTNNKNKIL